MKIENSVITELDVNQRELTVPADVTGISPEALANYVGDRVEKITVEKGNTVLYVENNCLIDKNRFLLILAGDDATIPDGVKVIGDFAFHRHEELEKIVIPSSVKEIRYMSFAATGLKEVVLPDGLTSIYGNTFALCDNLKEIKIPASVRKIYGTAFLGCENLKKINCKGNKHFSFDGTVLSEKSTGKVKADLKDCSVAKYLEKIAVKENVTVEQAMQKAVKFAEVPSIINVSKNDLAVFETNGEFLRAASTVGKGENKTEIVVDRVKHILKHAQDVLLMIEGGLHVTIDDITKVSEYATQNSDETAKINFCAGIDENLYDEIRLTVLAVVM